MLAWYNDFLSHYVMEADELQGVAEAGESVLSSSAAVQELSALIDRYYESDFDINAIEAERRALAEKSGVTFYTYNFIFLVCAAQRALAEYRKCGFSDTLFYDTFEDLLYKLRECRKIHGVWGIFVEAWYGIFFRLKLFKLGRLEFEVKTIQNEKWTEPLMDVANLGDEVLSVHIPSCGPLNREARMDSYCRAYEFFAGMRKKDKLLFICHSWLLYPKNREIFPPHINLVDFMNDWDILTEEPDPEYHDCWRLFSKDYDGKPENLRRDTTQQRAVADWLAAGNSMGDGLAFFLFDGEKILHE